MADMWIREVATILKLICGISFWKKSWRRIYGTVPWYINNDIPIVGIMMLMTVTLEIFTIKLLQFCIR
jgi:hypothetical protein